MCRSLSLVFTSSPEDKDLGHKKGGRFEGSVPYSYPGVIGFTVTGPYWSIPDPDVPFSNSPGLISWDINFFLNLHDYNDSVVTRIQIKKIIIKTKSNKQPSS